MVQPTLGVIFDNRDFSPDVLVTEARAGIQTLFSDWDVYHH
ncbi:MAG: hypothetical protein H6Q37_2428 [Chloroflexi bacterium]|nr:hypothetical protein [Chloroflexota bacterium]